MIGWIIIPAIALYAAIMPAPIIDRGYEIGPDVYHLEGTTWVTDGWGRIALAGHSPGIFDRVDDLGVGDSILITTDGGTARYVVRGHWVTTEDDVTWLAPTHEPTLVLITCYPGNKRMIVFAALAEN